MYGVDYARVDLGEAGQLYLTSYGLPWFGYLLPENWYENQRFAREGQRQMDGSGAVYRLSIGERGARGLELVVKFSRFAQSTTLYAGSSFPRGFLHEDLQHVYMNNPFEEFGLLMELRLSRSRECRSIITKRPLGIYCPATRYPVSSFGRTESRLARCQRSIQADQAVTEGDVAVALDGSRQYILLYQWVRGESAGVLHSRKQLSVGDVRRLMTRVKDELSAHGFAVLDNKPEHIILRTRADGTLLQRGGELAYALIDFELLKRLRDGGQPG